MELPPDFIHEAPPRFRYRTAKFKANVISIWCDHLDNYCFSNGDQVSTIWGFYNTKKRQYFAPINSKKIGAVVDINSTTNTDAFIENTKTVAEKTGSMDLWREMFGDDDGIGQDSAFMDDNFGG